MDLLLSAAVDFITDGDVEHLEASFIHVIQALWVVGGSYLDERGDVRVLRPFYHWT